MSWFKQQLANIAGTQEPEYGPSAIQTVTAQAQSKPYTEVTSKDLKWMALESTCVETQVFYFTNDDGLTAMAQVIYSNVAGIRTTCQFNSKIFDHEGPGKHLWCSDPLSHHKFDQAKTGFMAEKCSVILSEDGNSYRILSETSAENIVDITVTKSAPGFMAGNNGTSNFGTDPKKPWGLMRHVFWPRCKATGTMKTKAKTYTIKGQALFIHANQGMKPHHAAAKWNFINFQTPTYSAVVMEFTTPASYGKTTVNVGAISKDGELLYAGVNNTVRHTAANKDPICDWLEPKAIQVDWHGKTQSGQELTAELAGDLGQKVDRVDVLAHIPTIIKNLIGGVVGTKPIIYQYISKDKLTLKVRVGDNEVSEKGQLFSEATFIS